MNSLQYTLLFLISCFIFHSCLAGDESHVENDFLQSQQMLDGEFSLTVPPLEVGATADISAIGAEPDERALLIRGTALGEGSCPASLGGQCLGITGTVTMLARSRVNDDGVAEFHWPVSETAPLGMEFCFQAFIKRGPDGVDSVLTDAVCGVTCTGEDCDACADTDLDGICDDDSPDTPHVYDVAIVGAGASGLYAGYLLNQEDRDIVIIEASDTYGGRMRPLEGFADFPIELGAENLVGRGNTTGSNPSFIYEDIMATYPERLVRCWEDTPSTDELYDLGSHNEYAWETSDPDVIDLWNFYDSFGGYTGPDILMSEHLTEMLGMSTYNRMYHLYDGYFGGEYGTSNTRLGMHSLTRDWNMYLVGGGSFCFKGEGISYLSTMTDLYFNEVLDRVVYNSPVIEIDYTDDIAVVHDANGESYLSETVLVTPSVAVLRDELITFNPPLPEEKVAAYNTIGMDPGIKLILKFTEPFWDTGQMYALYTKGPTAMCWTPGLTRPDGTNNILICFIMGENAETMIALGEDGTIEQALADLDNMFPPDGASSVFDEAYIQNWTDEPWVRGVYSYGAPGTYPLDDGLSMRQILGQPVDDIIFFSGEATAINHSASVHGAVESGRRAANEILEVLE